MDDEKWQKLRASCAKPAHVYIDPKLREIAQVCGMIMRGEIQARDCVDYVKANPERRHLFVDAYKVYLKRKKENSPLLTG